MRYYFDASALVKRFKPERGQQTVRELLAGTARGEHEVVSLDWSRAEFCVAMWKAGVRPRTALRNLELLNRIALFQPISRPVIDECLGVIFEFALHAADAAHLAACLRSRCDVLASDDEDLVKAAVREYLERRGIRLLNLSESP